MLPREVLRARTSLPLFPQDDLGTAIEDLCSKPLLTPTPLASCLLQSPLWQNHCLLRFESGEEGGRSSVNPALPRE